MNKIITMLFILSTIGFASQTVHFDNNWAKYPLFNILAQSNQGVELVFSMQEMVIEDVEIDGVPMQTFGVAGVFIPEPGAPCLTGVSRYVALPQGAIPQLTIIDSRIETHHNIEVAPASNIPIESSDEPLTYVKDPKIYEQNALWPESPIRVSKHKQIRGVDVVIVGVIPFQYNPVTKDLIVYKDIKFRIDFVGGNGCFGENRLRSRFWEPILQGHLVNYNSLSKIDFYSPERIHSRDNVEYIIIVPDDTLFIRWADTVMAWRKLQGISAEVFTTTDIGGNTTTAIKNFLQNAYNTWNPAPAAFLILSDYQSSGKVYGVTSMEIVHPGGYPTYVSDNWYADYDDDTLPELHHGRICAQTATHLSRMINKFLSYERSPYTNAGYYSNPLIAGGWQTDRWFQMACEICRGFLDNDLGKTPVTQYAIYSGSPYAGCAWTSRVGSQPVIDYWVAKGYIPATNPHAASYWSNGNAAGISAAINAGTFLVQHRDHGDEDGWLAPSYHNPDLDGLNNTMFTFVNSTNCLTGRYHSAFETFTEKFHRIQYGALGLNAATSASASFVNDTYIWGMFDCHWPQFDDGYPLYDMTGYDNLRPCMAMTSGKYYLDALWFPDSVDAGQYRGLTYGLFHHHTDCFVTLYSVIPMNLTVSHAATCPAGQNYFAVTANDSAIIALTVNGEIIGVAEGTGSAVNVPIIPQTAGATILVTVTKANYRRYTANVSVIASSPLHELYTTFSGSGTDYTAISAYRDTMYCIADYYGASNVWCRYVISYNGGSNWYWWYADDTLITQESPDVTLRSGGGIGITYRFYDPTREQRYRHRTYSAGSWTTPINISDNEPYWNKPVIEYLGSDRYGILYCSWNTPVIRGAYFDRDDWIVGITEHAENSEGGFVSLAPNPSKGSAKLTYNVKKEGNVRIVLYDVAGRLVNEYLNQMEKPGTHELIINSHAYAAGIYFLRMENEDLTATRTMIIAR